MLSKVKTILCASTALCLYPASAEAQTATASPDPVRSEAQAQAPSGVQDIIVTANRREQSLQKVPVSVIAVQGETLFNLKIEGTADLPQLAPGLTVVRLGGIVPYIRGVGASNAGFTTESPVAIYLDGVYVANSTSGLFSFNSIERIEVLKGPQGTLYGRNSTGGLINVITRSPEDTMSVDASIGYANFDTLSADFYGSVPVTDNLSANVSMVYSDQRDGWARNNFTGKEVMKQKEFSVLSKLLWRPSPDTKVEMRGLYNYNRNNLGLAVTLIPGTTGVDGTTYQGKYRTNTRSDPFSRLRQYSVSLKFDQDLGSAKLMSLTAYTHARQPLSFAQSGVPGLPATGRSAIETAILGRSRTFTQELQLSSSSSSRFQWIAGAYYLRDDTLVQLDAYGTCVGSVCAGAPVPTRTTGFPTTRSISGYGEGTYDITDSTHLTLGARYTHDKKGLSGTAEPLQGRPNTPLALPSSVPLFPGAPYPGNPNGIPTSISASKLTFKAVLAQDFTDSIHGYASFNRGFKSGGFNPVTFANPPSRPETLDAYELGLKSDLFDRLLRVNLSLFRYDYRDIQLRSTAPPAPVGGAILINAAKARSKGFDVELSLAPTRSLTINGNMEYLDARYTSFPGGTCVTPRVIGGAVLGGSSATPCDLAGARLIQSPKFSYNVGFTYKLETDVGRFLIAANDGYKSTYNFDPSGRVKSSPYHLVNASVTWTTPSGIFDLQLFVKNLTNSYYYMTGQAATRARGDGLPARGLWGT